MAPSPPGSPLTGSAGFISSLFIEAILYYSLILTPVILVSYVIWTEILRYQARVPNLPGPRGYPLVGSLPALRGKVSAEQFRLWSQEYDDVFQVQLGERTAVVVNSAEAARALFLGQRQALMSRPLFYVLHGKVQGGSAVTSIGTSPWNQSCKQRRKVGATAMNLVSVDSYRPIINSESRGLLEDLLAASLNGHDNLVDIRDPVRKYAMNLVLTLNYGTRVEDIKQLRGDTVFAEMVRVETEISRLRNTSANYENYIPIMRPIQAIMTRLLGQDPDYMAKIGKRRVGYHKTLLENLRAEVATGTDKPCIQGNVLKDPESKGLSEGELLSVSLSMMAGADSSQPTVGWAILALSQRQDVQRKVYEAIVNAEGNLLEASDVSHSKVEYIDAFTKEVGRYFTALKLGLPRATHDDIGPTWNGATIPPKTLVFLNAWACSNDPKLYKDPEVFSPERWLQGNTTNLHQFAFGMGGRMCIANHLAHKALYTAFLHLVTHFEILPAPEDVGNQNVIDPLEGLAHKESFVAIPGTYNVRLVPRDLARTKRVLGLS